MRNLIRQSVLFSASAEKLFDMYLDPATHRAFTGAPVAIGKESGSKFQAFDGALTGIILEVVQSRLIVQSWRSTSFKTDDKDSTLILCFTQEDHAGRIDLIHLDVPEHDYDGVVQGWDKYYWKPWRAYLKNAENT